MENVLIKLADSGKKLILEIDTTVVGNLSKTGKTRVIASTHGFAKLDNGISVGLNVLREKEATVKTS